MEVIEQAQPKKTSKVEAFFDKYYALFFAPLIVAFLYSFALWQYGVYPFGNRYTAASYDLSAQICPFIEHLFDVFDGKSKLTFSYAIVGGADVTGTFLYFFISPFSFLFLIFGDGKVAHASSIVMLCKLMTISLSGTWFAKKLFKEIPDYICIVVGVAYAYCGYTFVSNTYINWMDFLIYLPFCVGAFKHFVKTEKFLPFSILVACCIYTCFSIACFSLFTVFPALVIYALLCVERGKKNRFIAYLSLSFFVAILLAMPVLLPALGAYTVSGRGGGLFENLWKGFTVSSVTGEINSFDSSTFISTYSQSIYRKWSYILSDSIFVTLTLVWFFRKGLKDKFAQFMLVAGVLTLLPLVVDEAMNLLNMGSYMSYALRFGHLNALYFLGGACLCLENICYKPLTAYDGTPLLQTLGAEPLTEPLTAEEQELPVSPKEGGRYEFKEVFRKENKRPLLWLSIWFGGVAIVCIFLLWFTSNGNYRRFLSLFGIESNGFSASYAHSLGGLEVITVLFLAVAVVGLLGVLFVGLKKISPNALAVALVAVVGVQVFFYNGQLVAGNASKQHETLNSYQLLNEELAKWDDGYYRVKDYNDKMTACAPFTGGSNSFSVFSSVIDADNFVTFQLFGYQGNGKNSYKSSHAGKGNRSDEFGDAFLGYKYFISDKNDSKYTGVNVEDLSYVEPVYARDDDGEFLLDEGGNKIQLSYGGLYVYKNKIVFPLGYKVQRGGFSFVAENINDKTNRRQNQKALYAYLRGKALSTSYVTPAVATELSEYLHGKAADVTVGAGKITAKVTAEKGEDLLLNFVAVKGYSVTVNGKKAKLVDNDLKFLLVELEEGENEVVFTYSSPYVKYAAVGAVAAIVMLIAVAVVVKKTKVVEKVAPVISWAGILLSVGVIAFFMIYPMGVFLSKVIALVKLIL